MFTPEKGKRGGKKKIYNRKTDFRKKMIILILHPEKPGDALTSQGGKTERKGNRPRPCCGSRLKERPASNPQKERSAQASKGHGEENRCEDLFGSSGEVCDFFLGGGRGDVGGRGGRGLKKLISSSRRKVVNQRAIREKKRRKTVKHAMLSLTEEKKGRSKDFAEKRLSAWEGEEEKNKEAMGGPTGSRRRESIRKHREGGNIALSREKGRGEKIGRATSWLRQKVAVWRTKQGNTAAKRTGERKRKRDHNEGDARIACSRFRRGHLSATTRREKRGHDRRRGFLEKRPFCEGRKGAWEYHWDWLFFLRQEGKKNSDSFVSNS